MGSSKTTYSRIIIDGGGVHGSYRVLEAHAVSLLQQLFFNIEFPIDIFCDSIGAQAIASNSAYHKRTKHINIKYHYVCEKITEGTLIINEVDSKDNLANIFTKALPQDKHNTLVSRLRLVSTPTEGGNVENGTIPVE